jgi:hypothetical protein
MENKALLFLAALLSTVCSTLSETLLQGAVYFDSRETLSQIQAFAAAKDNVAIERLIEQGRVSKPTPADQDVKATLSGNSPTSPAEFSFTDNPGATYWTLSKFIVVYNKMPSPAMAPTPKVEAAPEPNEPAPAAIKSKHPHRSEERTSDGKPDSENGSKIWHKVDGQWKWYPANRKPEVRRAIPRATLVSPQ